jgi:amidase
MTEMAFRTATELAASIRNKAIGSEELVDYYIDRIERLDGELNAIVVRDFERAREAAREADTRLARGEPDGPLHGLPMTIKESYDIAGLPTTWGIPMFKDNLASTDSQSVQAYKSAGAVFMGKTNVPMNLGDFQSYNEIYGTTRNPWDVSRTPGGSSGGSAAALAAGLTGLESGSDIGGSIRNPAHYCGVFGHKPTWLIVPPQGHGLPGMLAPPDIAVCGPLARSAEDLALAMGVLAGPQPLAQPGWRLDLPRPAKRSLREFKVAIWADDDAAPVDRQVADRALQLGETLAGCGATVSETARPEISTQLSHVTYQSLLNAIMTAGVSDEVYASLKQAAERTDPKDLSNEAVMARAAVISHRDWLRANNFREQLRHAWRDFFQEWDILICPIAATPAFEHDHSNEMLRTIEIDGVERPYFEQVFWAGLTTVAYLPSTVFPTGPSASGLPIGLQAVSAEYGDLITIDFARLVSQEIGGFQPPPDYR